MNEGVTDAWSISAFGTTSTLPGPRVDLCPADQVGFGGQYGYYYTGDDVYLLGTRCCDPSTGRFLNRDTIGYKCGENLYAF